MSVQRTLDLFAPQPSRDRRWNEPFQFDGETYDPKLDQPRLSGQILGVFALMSDGQWRTLGEIRAEVGGSEAGISARLRDLRKRRYGSHQVTRRHRGEASSGLYEYQVKGSR